MLDDSWWMQSDRRHALTFPVFHLFQCSRDVLRESESIDDGIGAPILNLTVFLLIAWLFIVGVLIRGIRSSGKASYFLALFPYVIIGILLVRAVTLDGAWNGILFFLKPRWDKILEPKVSSNRLK